MAIKPIRNAQDHDKALKEIERLWGSPPGTDKGDLLDIWIALVETYERATYPMDQPNPIKAIQFRLEQLGLDQRALIGVIGSRTRVYEVLRGDRPLSLLMIQRLRNKFGLSADALISQSVNGKRRVA